MRAREAVTRAAELEKRLEKILAGVKTSEAVSKAPLVLFLDALSRGEVGAETTSEGDPRPDANERLRDASGIDQPEDDEARTKPPRNQPVRRNPAPPQLRRVPTVIDVPPAERACPRCGKERRCIGHDITEVIELIPAEVVVRQGRSPLDLPAREPFAVGGSRKQEPVGVHAKQHLPRAAEPIEQAEHVTGAEHVELDDAIGERRR